MTVRAPAPPMVSVYDGQKCLGFIFNRGCRGFEAFDADEHSLGVFRDQRDALDAIPSAADKGKS
jgi:hypothetical protein